MVVAVDGTPSFRGVGRESSARLSRSRVYLTSTVTCVTVMHRTLREPDGVYETDDRPALPAVEIIVPFYRNARLVAPLFASLERIRDELNDNSAEVVAI